MARFILRHRFLIVLGWAALTAAGIVTLGRVGPRLDYRYTTPGEPGYESNLKITQRFGIDPAFESILPVLDLPPGMTMATDGGRKMAAAVFAAAPGAGPMVVADYATTRDPMFILDGGRATWALIAIANPDYGPGRGVESRVQRVVTAATPAGANMTVTGFAQMLSNAGPNRASLVKGAVFGIGLAFATLVLVYGSPIAVLPILMAIPAICVTFLCVLGMTYVSSVSYFVEYMVVLLSLGISIDFSLIVVVRWREERVRGLANEEAVIAAVQSAGRAVALSGVTAAVGLLSLVVLPVPFLRSVGYGGMLIPFVAVCVAVTLLPVCLSWAGPALDRFSLWSGAATTYSRGWERWTKFVLDHQWKAAGVGILIIGITAMPALSMKTGEPLIGSLMQVGRAPEAFHRLQGNGIPSAVDFPIYVMTHGGAAATTEAIKIAKETPGVYGVLSPDNASYRRGADTLLTVIPTAEGSLVEGKAIVGRLRARLADLPGGAADVGGSTAEDVSFTDAVYGNFPLMLTVVSLVTLAILMFALRSVVLAIKAVLLNVASLGSAFGFMVFFWQQGHGSSLVYGMPATDAIRAWIPTVVFASLFGLSMDYEVFVLSRIREEFDRAGSTRDAIVAGMARTGRLVTCTALILMVTFLSLSIGPNQIVKISATTLAVGIIMDAVIIRSLLVPALVSLLGRWNWWMPAGLVPRTRTVHHSISMSSRRAKD
jgi:putative drug exporter of the RND superfamily